MFKEKKEDLMTCANTSRTSKDFCTLGMVIVVMVIMVMVIVTSKSFSHL